MFWRAITFVMCQALVGLAVYLLDAGPQRLTLALLAALLGSYAWLVFDTLRGMRLLKWLRDGDTSDIPLGSGYWGELFDRVRKLVRLLQGKIGRFRSA